jgi:hypothetical protein
MPFEHGGLSEDGKIILKWVDDPPKPEDERWRDRKCFLCGKDASWFRCLMAYDLSFCSDCLPDTFRLNTMADSAELIVMSALVRHLWKGSHGVRIR